MGALSFSRERLMKVLSDTELQMQWEDRSWSSHLALLNEPLPGTLAVNVINQPLPVSREGPLLTLGVMAARLCEDESFAAQFARRTPQLIGVALVEHFRPGTRSITALDFDGRAYTVVRGAADTPVETFTDKQFVDNATVLSLGMILIALAPFYPDFDDRVARLHWVLDPAARYFS